MSKVTGHNSSSPADKLKRRRIMLIIVDKYSVFFLCVFLIRIEHHSDENDVDVDDDDDDG